MLDWSTMIRPCLVADTATPGRACTWMVQLMCGSARRMPEWKLSPAGPSIDAVVADDLAALPHGREVRGGDLVPAEPERVHQEVVGPVGQADADVVVDLQVPAVVVRDAERGGGLDAGCALGLAHVVAAGAGLELRRAIMFMVFSCVARIIVAPARVGKARTRR